MMCFRAFKHTKKNQQETSQVHTTWTLIIYTRKKTQPKHLKYTITIIKHNHSVLLYATKP